MPNKHRIKGNKTVREGIKLLEENGWQCSVVERGGKFVKEKDLWGLFDAACIKGNHIKFIQFKTNRPSGIKKTKVFAKTHLVPNVSYEIWTRIDNKPIDKRWDGRMFYYYEEI